ncbi:DUF4192 domain-containing protein [Amycolatopsis thermophila]|uniref:DUF4192 domain-containing protein n=1 Tax=Amycolatopsis thermophila TaxID=206084 RepID=A0ABU0EYJ3_9PSEU|nr:DUF4192 domain-containing protein [Amycolatopsis thermophila]MDQ0380031.1 hypothetical protein [Amycolatopsis thermophila]
MTSTTTHTGTDGRVTVRISDPGELIAAVPHLLSFRPGPSVVLLNHAGAKERRILPVIRADLPDESFEPDAVRELVRRLLRHPGAGVTVVIIGCRPGHRAPPGEVPHKQLAGLLVRALDDVGRPVDHALWVPEIRAGVPWRCYLDDCPPGVLPDDRDTVMAAAMATRGWVTYDSREEMSRLLDPDDPAAIERRQRMLDAAVDRLAEAPAPEAIAAAMGHFGAEESAAHLSVVRAALARAEAGDLDLSDEDVVSLAMALSNLEVRDRCLRTAEPPGEPASNAAERLWLELVRRTPPPERAEPAVLLGYSAYRRGDCVLAGLAFDNALTARPGHRLAELLDLCLDRQIPPAALSRLSHPNGGAPMANTP